MGRVRSLRYHVGIVVVLWCNTRPGIPTPTTTNTTARLRLQSLVASIEHARLQSDPPSWGVFVFVMLEGWSAHYQPVIGLYRLNRSEDH